MKDRSYKIACTVLLLAIVWLGICSMTYQIKHPEQTQAQVLLKLHKIVLFDAEVWK